ncbi:MAG TPA: GyrI-like domain-containing protein [Bacillota bacterium]
MVNKKLVLGILVTFIILVIGGTLMYFFGVEETIEPKIITLNEPIKAVGLSIETNMNTVYKDVSLILKKYMDYKNQFGISNLKEPWEFVALSRNFRGNQSWEYLVGDVVTDFEQVPRELTSFQIPVGTYAIFPIVKPFTKLLWGLKIGKTKKYIYDTWLPNSQYEFAGFEFEYNNQKIEDEKNLLLNYM